MDKLLVVCVDDEREVLDSVLNDLSFLSECFELDGAESVSETKEVISDFEGSGGKLALILADHIMPGELGIDLLIDLNHQTSTENAKKVLLTGQAALNETIEAINRGGLNHYLAKPWTKEQLLAVVKDKLTDYVLEHCPNPMPYSSVLDGERIFKHAAQHRMDISG